MIFKTGARLNRLALVVLKGVCMTVDEVFTAIVSHMVKGVMMHEQLSSYYAFAGLHGYEKYHSDRYIEESKTLIKTSSYYTSRYGKLVQDIKIDIPKLIPQSMYKHTTEELGTNDIRQIVKATLKEWVDWEAETKELYEDCYTKLISDNAAVADAMFVAKLIKEVDKEHSEAYNFWLCKKATEFDISLIISEQKDFC